MFNFSDLVLEQITIEVRYGNGYLYVDRCGSVLRTIMAKWTSAIAESVAVHETKISVPDKQITLAFSEKRISLTQLYPSSISEIG